VKPCGSLPVSKAIALASSPQLHTVNPSSGASLGQSGSGHLRDAPRLGARVCRAFCLRRPITASASCFWAADRGKEGMVSAVVSSSACCDASLPLRRAKSQGHAVSLSEAVAVASPSKSRRTSGHPTWTLKTLSRGRPPRSWIGDCANFRRLVAQASRQPVENPVDGNAPFLPALGSDPLASLGKGGDPCRRGRAARRAKASRPHRPSSRPVTGRASESRPAAEAPRRTRRRAPGGARAWVTTARAATLLHRRRWGQRAEGG